MRVLSGVARAMWEDSVLNDRRLEKSTDAFLMRTLLDYCGGKAMCWPSTKTLARRMRLSERSIQLSVGRCISLGILDRHNKNYVILSHPDAARILWIEVVPIERTRHLSDAERHQWWQNVYQRQRERNRRIAGLA